MNGRVFRKRFRDQPIAGELEKFESAMQQPDEERFSEAQRFLFHEGEVTSNVGPLHRTWTSPERPRAIKSKKGPPRSPQPAPRGLLRRSRSGQVPLPYRLDERCAPVAVPPAPAKEPVKGVRDEQRAVLGLQDEGLPLGPEANLPHAAPPVACARCKSRSWDVPRGTVKPGPKPKKRPRRGQ